MEKRYTAGELARCAGVSARTIRFYEEKGILQPKERSAEGYRLYDDSAILRLQEILMLKYVGLSEGGTLVSTFTSQISVGDVNRLLEPALHRRVLEVYEVRKRDFVEQMEKLFDREFGRVSRKVFHNGLRINQPEELLRYLCSLDGELEARIKSRESEVRRYLQELTEQGCVPVIGTESYCYFCQS